MEFKLGIWRKFHSLLLARNQFFHEIGAAVDFQKVESVLRNVAYTVASCESKLTAISSVSFS